MKLGGCPPIIKVNNDIKKKREFKMNVDKRDNKNNKIIDIKNILGIKL
jgi:hypothetical protein